jgi:mannitol/fructose-specific phosphotransferase system IIA component (Ntr-type)
MEIILGLLALQQGLIGERLFVALVIMALVTSMLSGPMMQRLLGRRKSRQITDYLTARAFLHPLHAHNRQEAIAALSRVMRPTPGLSADSITAAVMERECIMPTGLSHGVALPHARLAGVSAPVVAVGLSSAGIDFDAADGQLAQIIFLLLTPLHDDGAQLEILADITRIFRHAEVRERALEVGNYTEFLALLKSESADVS